MKRLIDNQFEKWKDNAQKKVLLLRGARQVGKTYSVRELGKKFGHFLEVNFESDHSVHEFFSMDLNPDEICRNLSAFYNVPVEDGKTLVFFDEIQSCLQAISSLRYFHEKRPGLHLVAAGSLLEFALKEIPSFGIGRIEHLYMYPMSFNEFLWANHERNLCELLENASPAYPIHKAFHQKLTRYLKQFLYIGGLPEVVKIFINTGDLQKAQSILDGLITGLDDDFSKYKKHIPVSRIKEVFQAVTIQSGNKFILSKAAGNANHEQIKEALTLLEMAGLVHKVKHSHANGIPLGGEINQKKFKTIMFDHGVFQRILGLELSQYLLATDFDTINKGNLAEQFAGTEILKYANPQTRAQLYYWHREKRGSNAEVDYMIQKSDKIIPVEIKSGKQGKMQSMWLFINEKKPDYGIRISLENFSKYDKILVYPLYAIWNIFHPVLRTTPQ